MIIAELSMTYFAWLLAWLRSLSPVVCLRTLLLAAGQRSPSLSQSKAAHPDRPTIEGRIYAILLRLCCAFASNGAYSTLPLDLHPPQFIRAYNRELMNSLCHF